MCYLGTNSEIEEKIFDKENPKFCIEKFDKNNFDKNTFKSEFVYYIGTSFGCGCGFGFEEIPQTIIDKAKYFVQRKLEIPENLSDYFAGENSIEEIEETVNESKIFFEDTNKFYSLILEKLNKDKSIEFFGCWDGTEKNKIDKTLELTINDKITKIEFREFWDFNVKINYKKMKI